MELASHSMWVSIVCISSQLRVYGCQVGSLSLPWRQVYTPEIDTGTLIPSAQRFVWAAKQTLGKAALGALFA